MRYWRLTFVSFLLTFSIAGCHRKVERALPPAHAEAPIVSTMPALPPLTVKPVILVESQPTPAAAPPPVVAPPPKKQTAKVRHHHVTPKPDTEGESTDTKSAASPATSSGAPANPPAAPATAIIGQLSADDSAATPTDAAQTKHLIDSTEKQLKKLSTQQQTEHKDAVAQVDSFLAQARQALSMNDMVGAQTLANKAKILVDELSR
jgi:hypothetical protein